MLVIDPMHNQFLGSGKHMLNVLKLSPSQFQPLQERVDSSILLSDVGRIPRKMETGFPTFFADQFKNCINFVVV